jgi:hypothetical protein
MTLKKLKRGVSRVLAAAHSGMALPMVVAGVLLATVAPAHADSITINPTFDPSIAGVSGAEAAINAAIAAVEGAIYSPNNITVNIYFSNASTGLGESITGIYSVSYDAYYNAFKAVATNPTQLTALSSLGTAPTGPSSGNPVNGGTVVDITSAEGRNLGFNTPAAVTVGSGTYDTEILLNTSITSPPNGLSGNYGLQAVANHEIDEALGIGGTGSFIDSGFGGSPVGDLDLYRYSAPGVRTLSDVQTTTPFSYFSINGGTTVLSYFNQTAGADYGDWLSNPIPGGFSPQVQDAFGEPGTNPALGSNEITAFEAIGYGVNANTSAVPEPTSLTLLGLGLAGAAARRRAKRKQ